MNKNIMILSLSLALSLPAFAEDKKDCDDASNFPEISYQDLKQKIAANEAIVIDVNSKESFEKKGKVDGAIHYGSNKKNLKSVLKPEQNKDKLVVAYCGGPQCTAWEAAATAACEMGFTKIQHYKGGIKGWLENEKKGSKTKA